jgi:glucokinase
LEQELVPENSTILFVEVTTFMANQIYIGVDLGGTNIKVGLCDEHGSLLHTYVGPTGTEEGAEAVLERIAQYVRKIVESSNYEWEQVAGIGAGLAGFMDIPEGFV